MVWFCYRIAIDSTTTQISVITYYAVLKRVIGDPSSLPPRPLR